MARRKKQQEEQEPVSDFERLQGIASGILEQMEYCHDPHKLKELSAAHANILKSMQALGGNPKEELPDDGFLEALGIVAQQLYTDDFVPDVPQNIDDSYSSN